MIWHLETWDITTIRASIGMYLVCKYIHENTDLKVLLTGEVSDEIFGYKYTDFAPNAAEFQKRHKNAFVNYICMTYCVLTVVWRQTRWKLVFRSVILISLITQ